LFKHELLDIHIHDATLEKDFRKASHLHSNNIDKVYVIALGMKVGLAKHAVSEIEKAKLYAKTKDWEYTIVGRKRDNLKAMSLKCRRFRQDRPLIEPLRIYVAETFNNFS